MPASFRNVIQEKGVNRLVVTRSNDACLLAFTVDAWEKLIVKVADMPMMDPEVAAFERVFAANASAVPIDRQGRVLLPDFLREYADLEKEVLFAGRLSKFEIWRPDRWEDVMRQSAERLASANGRIGSLV